MAKIRKTAQRLLLVLLSASIFFNSPALAELVFCIGPDCESEEAHAAGDPCESTVGSTQEPSLHSHEEDGGCESCIRLSLLQKAGESIRPAPAPDGSQLFPPAPSLSGLAFHEASSNPRLFAPSPPQGNLQLVHLRTIRLLI